MLVSVLMPGCIEKEIDDPNNIVENPGGENEGSEDTEGSEDSEGIKEVEVVVAGSAQKGQFTKGSQLTAFGMDETLTATGQSFPGNISDDMGNFVISGKTTSKYLELRAEGYYFNEVTGSLDGPLYLDALIEPTANNANVNVLTTIIKPRLKSLIKSGMTYKEALKQAQQEFLNSMGYDLELLDFDKMDITKSSDSDAFLLALACMIQVNKSAPEVSAFIQNLASDMEDGTLDVSNVLELKNLAESVNPSEVLGNLNSFYQNNGIADAVVPEFWNYFTDAPKGTYSKLLSSRILKGVVSSQYQLYVIDAECDEETSWAINDKYNNDIFIETNTFYEFDFNNPTPIYGECELEFITFGNNVLLDNYGGSTSLSLETEALENNTFKHKLRVNSNFYGSSFNIIIGGEFYYINIQPGGTLDQLDFSEEKCFLTLNIDHTMQGMFHGSALVSVNGKYYFPWPKDDSINTGIVIVPKEDEYNIEAYLSSHLTFKGRISDSGHSASCFLELHPELYSFNIYAPEWTTDKTSVPSHIMVNGNKIPVYCLDIAGPCLFHFVYNIENVSELHVEYVTNGKTYYGYFEINSDGSYSYQWFDQPLDQFKAVLIKDPYNINTPINVYYKLDGNMNYVGIEQKSTGVYTALIPEDAIYAEFVCENTSVQPFLNVGGTLSSSQVEYNGKLYYEIIWDEVDESLFTTINIDMTATPKEYSMILQIFDLENYFNAPYYYDTSIGGRILSYRVLKHSKYKMYFDVFKQVVYDDGSEGEIPYGYLEKTYTDDGSGELNITLDLKDLILHDYQ